MSAETIARTSITLPEAVFELGKENAKKKRRSFSSYLAVLIEEDSKLVATGNVGEAQSTEGGK